MATLPKAREVKVVLLGDTGVGKSSLAVRFVQNQFDPFTESTIGASFLSKTLSVDSSEIKFQIWDTAGQEQYNALTRIYYRGAAVAVVVYDITRRSSFERIGKTWINELQRQGPADIVMALVGNKSDLEVNREVPRKEAQAYAKEIGAIFIETSARTDSNVALLFTEIGRILPDPSKKATKDTGNNVVLTEEAKDPHDKDGCAC